MNICFVIDRYPPRPHSSIGSFVQNMARGLSTRGHQATVVELGESEEERYDDRIRVITLRRSNVRYVGNFVTRIRLRNWLNFQVKNGKIQVIEVPDYSGFIPFKITDCPVVVRLHQTATGVRRCNGEKLAMGIYYYEKRNLILNSNWIAVSQHILNLTESIFGISPRFSKVIYNPLFPVSSPLPDMNDLPNQYVLYVGEICKRKGSLILAEAARSFLSSRPKLHLVYVGSVFKEEGRLVSEKINEILGPELERRVHFLGRIEREKVFTCMSKAKVFAFPSRLEAMPLVLVEAMSLGVPVVSMNCPPGPEIVEDGVTGLLADPMSPEDFNQKISAILDDNNFARILAENAKLHVSERFSFKKCLEATEQFYEKCLNDKGGFLPLDEGCP